MKKKLGYESEADIDQKIRDIEYELQTESFTLKQEKERIIQISELRKTKPLVTKYNKMEGINTTGDVSSLRESVDGVFAELKELRDARKVQQAALAKLNEARQKVMGDVPELFTEREAIKSQIREQFQKKNDLRDSFNLTNRAYNAYQNEVRQVRGERARLERQAREEEWKAHNKAEKEAEGPPPAPFTTELTELDNMLKHFKSLLPTEVAKAEAAKAEAAPKAAEGQMVLMGKESRDEEFFFAPTKRKNLRKKGTGEKKKALVHVVETLSICDKYKVAVPSDVSAVAAALEQVEKKVLEYKEKQKKALEKKDKKEEVQEKKEGDEEKNESADKTEEAAEAVAA